MCFGAMSFGKLSSLPFWIATFSLSMVLIFENMGLLHGLLEDDRKFPRAYQANAISAMTCGLFGTSPTVSTVESAAGITAGGKDRSDVYRYRVVILCITVCTSVCQTNS